MVDSNTTTAALGEYYPRFRAIPPPGIMGAQRAWQGQLRPLARTDETPLILDDLEHGRTVRVLNGGTLHHDPDCNQAHKHLSHKITLTRLVTEFSVVLVEFGTPRHPQVYSIRPAISAKVFPTHPHLRRDQLACILGNSVHGLCTYLASDGVLQRDAMALVHALDFTAIFLAKHTVWQSSATLTAYELGWPPKSIAHDPSGVALYFPIQTSRSGELRWEGHWPGPDAPHGTEELLAIIRPDAECPCASGAPYDRCCRDNHLRLRTQAQARFLNALATAATTPTQIEAREGQADTATLQRDHHPTAARQRKTDKWLN